MTPRGLVLWGFPAAVERARTALAQLRNPQCRFPTANRAIRAVPRGALGVAPSHSVVLRACVYAPPRDQQPVGHLRRSGTDCSRDGYPTSIELASPQATQHPAEDPQPRVAPGWPLCGAARRQGAPRAIGEALHTGRAGPIEALGSPGVSSTSAWASFPSRLPAPPKVSAADQAGNFAAWRQKDGGHVAEVSVRARRPVGRSGVSAWMRRLVSLIGPFSPRQASKKFRSATTQRGAAPAA